MIWWSLACKPDAPVVGGETGESGGFDAPDDAIPGGRQPFRDIWREELSFPAANIERLRIGGTLTNDNFANRGDIDVVYVEGTRNITIELQRFSFDSELDDAEHKFERTTLWAYASETVHMPGPLLADTTCTNPDARFCHVRVYYDGLIQPARSGANIRVMVPSGWPGRLELSTEDNLQEPGYPDRGDILVDGLAGHLDVMFDSGRASIRLDDDFPYFPGCPHNDACEAEGLAPDCGCEEFARVHVQAREEQAATITVDAPAWKYYDASLRNDDPLLELGCVVEVDCGGFDACELDEDYVSVDNVARAVINYPGPPAAVGAGIQIELVSGACAMIEHAEQPTDYFTGPGMEVRGDVRFCSGCL